MADLCSCQSWLLGDPSAGIEHQRQWVSLMRDRTWGLALGQLAGARALCPVIADLLLLSYNLDQRCLAHISH